MLTPVTACSSTSMASPRLVTIRGVLDTEVNPSIAGHGPIVNSVLMPLATMRAVMQSPDGYNLIFVHNRGTGGFDDLGPGSVTGDEVTKHFRVEFTDPQAAADLWAYLSTPAIKGQVKKIHDQASFLDPTQDFSRPAPRGAEPAGRHRRVQSAGGRPVGRTRHGRRGRCERRRGRKELKRHAPLRTSSSCSLECSRSIARPRPRSRPCSGGPTFGALSLRWWRRSQQARSRKR